MDLNSIFRVVIHEGRGFGQDTQALVCSATFGDSVRSTAFSVGRDKHNFSTELAWRTSKTLMRRLASTGQNTCKVVVSRKEGQGDKVTPLGWVVLDLRQAKLNHEYKKSAGDWHLLVGQGTSGAPPQLRVAFWLEEDLPKDPTPGESLVQAMEQRLQGPTPSTPAPMAPSTPSHAALIPPSAPAPPVPAPLQSHPILAAEDSYASDFHSTPSGGGAEGSGGSFSAPAPQAPASAARPMPHGAGRMGAEGGQGRGAPTPSAIAAPPSASASAALLEGEGPWREFRFTLDVRSFQAGSRLPLNIANVYVQAVLPPDLLELVVACGRRLPGHLAPLRTQPTVEVARGAEGSLPNGVGSMEVVAGVVQLARVLARGPCIALEIWHKERFRADSLLGLASVPLATLLHDAWVDGYAPVAALAVTSVGGAGQQERIQVGMLRVIISLEDLGAALPPWQTSAPAPSPAPQPFRYPTAPPHPQHDLQGYQGEGAGEQGTGQGAGQGQGERGQPGPGAGAQGVLNVPQVQQLPEYEAAYHLEVWKKEEETAWRVGQREREAARMTLLEGEWRRRERAREAEAAALRAEYQALEQRTRGVLAAVEVRERQLVDGEEAVARRRRDMEREHTSRMAEAEAAVRRLQVECEHQLEIERDRNGELARLRASLEERLAVSESRGVALEQAFAAYRDQVRNTSEAGLARELGEAREMARRSEERAVRASRAKAAYKQQVVQLAEQLAGLYRARLGHAGEGAPRPGSLEGMRDGVRGIVQRAEEEQARYATHQAAELATLRQQLADLKASALAGFSPSRLATFPGPNTAPSPAPRPPTAAVAPSGPDVGKGARSDQQGQAGQGGQGQPGQGGYTGQQGGQPERRGGQPRPGSPGQQPDPPKSWGKTRKAGAGAQAEGPPRKESRQGGVPTRDTGTTPDQQQWAPNQQHGAGVGRPEEGSGGGEEAVRSGGEGGWGTLADTLADSTPTRSRHRVMAPPGGSGGPSRSPGGSHIPATRVSGGPLITPGGSHATRVLAPLLEQERLRAAVGVGEGDGGRRGGAQGPTAPPQGPSLAAESSGSAKTQAMVAQLLGGHGDEERLLSQLEPSLPHATAAEVRRLLRSRGELLAMAYPADDSLVQRIEARVAQLLTTPMR